MIWKDITKLENKRREGVEVEWDASQEVFDNVTNLTVESTSHKRNQTKPVGDKDNSKVVEKVACSATRITVDEPPVRKESTASTDTQKEATVIATNSPNKQIELMANSIGVLPTTTCSFCEKLTSRHYCRASKKGSNVFF